MGLMYSEILSQMGWNFVLLNTPPPPPPPKKKNNNNVQFNTIIYLFNNVNSLFT